MSETSGATGSAAAPSAGEILAFETAVRDLVGLALRSVERVDISLPQFRLLLSLRESGPSSSSDCARALGVVGSTITRLADRLHSSGHLVRGADPDNRSIVVLTLTDAGRRVVDEVTAHRRSELHRLLEHLDPALRASCSEALHHLHEVLATEPTDGARHHHVPM
ncbi:MAG: MarR family transcriptional regulator [Gordonia sp. (in: high G+C Gram-positive bacteria)]|uniref:MarR family winged helix-turn-helix transcriptional regulator n=1 Tax=Gordonia TaxID=2053 RepID=UPI003266A629